MNYVNNFVDDMNIISVVIIDRKAIYFVPGTKYQIKTLHDDVTRLQSYLSHFLNISRHVRILDCHRVMCFYDKNLCVGFYRIIDTLEI